MITVLFFVQVILAVTLVISVLLQRSDQDGFGLGSGSGAGLLSGRTKANLLTRTTAIIATLFMLNSILLTILSTHGSDDSLARQIENMANPETQKQEVPATVTTAPVVPREGESLQKTEPAVPQPEKTEPVEPTTSSPKVTEPEVPTPTESVPAAPEPTEVPKAK